LLNVGEGLKQRKHCIEWKNITSANNDKLPQLTLAYPDEKYFPPGLDNAGKRTLQSKRSLLVEAI
jgi:hypothetical protein